MKRAVMLAVTAGCSLVYHADTEPVAADALHEGHADASPDSRLPLDAHVADAGVTCPADYEAVLNTTSKYKRLAPQNDWTTMRAACQSTVAAGTYTHLAVAAGIGELEQLHDHYPDASWIGLHDVGGARAWVTAEGGDFPTSKDPIWTSDPAMSGTECAILLAGSSGGPALTNTACNEPHFAICECDGQPPL